MLGLAETLYTALIRSGTTLLGASHHVINLTLFAALERARRRVTPPV
ncbi:MAG: hypothetical protein ACYCV6_09210 [Steroidobacteraceae bacterium]